MKNRLSLLLKLGLSVLRQVAKMPLLTLGAIFVFAFTLYLAMAFYLLALNREKINDSFVGNAELAVYLKKNQSLSSALQDRLSQHPLIARVHYAEKKVATPQHKTNAKNNKNKKKTASSPTSRPSVKNSVPAPDFIVYPNIKLFTNRDVNNFLEELSRYEEVETIKADINLLKRESGLSVLLNTAVLWLLVLSTLGAIIVIFSSAYLVTQHLQANASSRGAPLRGAPMHGELVLGRLLPLQFVLYGVFGCLLAIIVQQRLLAALRVTQIFLEDLTFLNQLGALLLAGFVAYVGAKMALLPVDRSRHFRSAHH